MEKDEPNIILITIDCLRADHMSCYGYCRGTTPFMDSLAWEGLLFKNAFTNGSFTALSVPSFLTSRLPFLWGGEPYISEILRQKGYSTAAFNPNHLLISLKKPNTNRGFEKYEAFLKSETGDKLRNFKENFTKIFSRDTVPYKITSYFLTHLSYRMKPKCARANEINEEFFKWLDENKSPFFSWIHYMDVHHPTLPFDKYLKKLGIKKISESEKAKINRKILNFPEKLTEKEIKKRVDLYDASIRFVDEMVEELVEELKDRGIWDNTIIIITADHGEEFGEHGGFLHDAGHLYEEILHIPLIISPYPASIEKNEMVSLLDLAPTVAQLANIKMPEQFEGKSLLGERYNPYIMGMGCKHRKKYIETGFENVPKTIFCRTKKYKLIYNEDTEDYELYMISTDPNEKNNIYHENKDSEFVSELEKLIQIYRGKIRESGKLSRAIDGLKIKL